MFYYFFVNTNNSFLNFIFSCLIFGLFCAFGVTLNDGLSSLIAFTGLSFLNQKIEIYLKLFGSFYILFIGLKTFFSNNKIIETEEKPKTRYESLKEGFLISFLNPAIAIGNASLLINATFGMNIKEKIFYHIVLFLVSFFCFTSLALIFNRFNKFDVFLQIKHYLIKILGITTIYLGLNFSYQSFKFLWKMNTIF